MKLHQKVETLTELYEKGLMTKYEYWDQRYKETMPELLRQRTILCKPMGLLAHYLREFSIYVCYIKYMSGELEGETLKRWKHQAEMNKLNREEAKVKAIRRQKHMQVLANL